MKLFLYSQNYTLDWILRIKGRCLQHFGLQFLPEEFK